MSASGDAIPRAVVRRLPRYLACVEEARGSGARWISSKEIAERLGLTSSTVRQDLTHVDYSGVCRRGYSTTELEATLARMLCVDREVKVVIVGAGNLGKALAMHGEFKAKGFKICGIADADPRLAGKTVGRLLVRKTEDLPKLLRESGAQIGIIAVPSRAAQEVADQLIISGVSGLLNLAHVHVIAPKWVSVREARITASLQELCYAMRTNPDARDRAGVGGRKA